jgi:hypothetical protein
MAERREYGIFVCVCGTGVWTQAYTLSHSTSPFFCDGFFEIGSHKLFVLAGFETQSF